MTRVLIVDDHGEIRHLIRLALEPSGHDLDEAADAASALERIRARRPDVLILDVMMPGDMDGYELCAYLKGSPEWRGIFVILLTARGQQTDVEKGKAAGSDAYLVKPFSPTALEQLVASHSAGAPHRP